ncbi:MAG: SRPBCC family protein [Methylococcaceae bacterium]
MKKLALIAPVLLLSFSGLVNAHGPVRQKTQEEITINAPAEKVWNIIKSYGDITWLPPIKNSSITKGTDNTEGAVRVLTLQDGGTITEELKKYDASKMSYSYKITDMSTAKTITHAGAEEKVPVVPVDNYSASIEVDNKGATSTVIWKAAYYRAYVNNDPPAEMNEEAANKAIEGIFKTGLANLKALAEK